MLLADLTLLLHTQQVADEACFFFLLHTLHAGTALVISCLCCRRDRLPLWRVGLICLCYCRLVSQRDCLPTLAFHVNVHALISPPPWSIVSLFRPPLQRCPSVVTVVTLASTYCSFPVCGDRQEVRESPFVRPKRASLSFAVLLKLPPLWRAALPRSESSVGDPVVIAFCFICRPLWRAAQTGQLIIAFMTNLPHYRTRPVLGASAP